MHEGPCSAFYALAIWVAGPRPLPRAPRIRVAIPPLSKGALVQHVVCSTIERAVCAGHMLTLFRLRHSLLMQ